MKGILKLFLMGNSYIFTRTMGLFWLFAEAFCLVFVRRAYHQLLSNETFRREKTFILALMGGFLFLVFLTFGQGFILKNFIQSSFALTKSLKAYYYSSLWRLFCTLWVLIEGAIVIYITRIYQLMTQKKVLYLERKDPLMVAFLAGFMLLPLLYEGVFIHVVINGGVNWRGVMNISRFYIKICGFFWILFEGIVALLGWRAYRFLTRQKDEPGYV